MNGIFKRKLKIGAPTAIITLIGAGLIILLRSSLGSVAISSLQLSDRVFFLSLYAVGAGCVALGLCSIIYQLGAYFSFENGTLSAKHGFFKRFSFPIGEVSSVFFRPGANIFVLIRSNGKIHRIRGLANSAEMGTAIFRAMPEGEVTEKAVLDKSIEECAEVEAGLVRRMRLVILISLLIFIANELVYSRFSGDYASTSYDVLMSILTLAATAGVVLYFFIRRNTVQNSDRRLALQIEKLRCCVYNEPVPANCIEIFTGPAYMARFLVCRQQEEYYITVEEFDISGNVSKTSTSDFYESLEELYKEFENSPVKLIRRL